MNINFKKWAHKIPENTVAVEIHGSRKTAQKEFDEGWFLCWTPKRIKGAFNFGNGTIKDLKNHANLNRQYCTIIFMNRRTKNEKIQS